MNENINLETKNILSVKDDILILSRNNLQESKNLNKWEEFYNCWVCD